MNTRIDKLWGQALDQSVPETWTTLNPAQLVKLKAKFAELIVRECINTLEFHGFDNAIPYVKWMAKNKLGQHFGVEE